MEADKVRNVNSEPSGVTLVPQLAFVDLKSQYRRLKADIDQRIHAVLDHGAYVNGPEVKELEDRLAEFTGAKSVVAVSSGTDALIIPLLHEGIEPGDAVFIPAFTYNATANAVLLAGGTPVFVDVDPRTFTMDVDHLREMYERVVKDGKLVPRGIIPVDLFGLPADYPAINGFAEKNDLFVLSDAAQSLGGGQGNQRVGTLAKVSGTSFFPSKTLGGYGDGGAIFTTDEEKAKAYESIRWHGTDDARKESIRIGMNGRIDSIQAAVLLAKLSIFDEELEIRRRIAEIYNERLKDTVVTPLGVDGSNSAWALYSILVDDRDGVRERLSAKNVPTAIYYDRPLYAHKAFAAYHKSEPLVVCEDLSKRILTIPLHPYMSEAQAHEVCDKLQAVL